MGYVYSLLRKINYLNSNGMKRRFAGSRRFKSGGGSQTRIKPNPVGITNWRELVAAAAVRLFSPDGKTPNST